MVWSAVAFYAMGVLPKRLYMHRVEGEATGRNNH